MEGQKQHFYRNSSIFRVTVTGKVESLHKVKEAGICWVFTVCLWHLILATPIWDRHACPHFPDEKLRHREKKQPAHRCRASGWQICNLNRASELSYELKLTLAYPLGNCWLWLSQGQTLLPVKLYKDDDLKGLTANTRLKLWPLSQGEGWCGRDDKSSKQWFWVSLYPVRKTLFFLKET